MITIAGLTNFSLARVSTSYCKQCSADPRRPLRRPGPVAAHRSVELLCDQNLVIAALPAAAAWMTLGKPIKMGKNMMDFELPYLITNGCDIRVIISFLSVILNAYHDHCDDHE